MSGQPPDYGGGYGPPPPGYGQDPYGQPPPYAPAAGPPPTARAPGPTPLGRIGLILIALGGLVFAFAAFTEIARNDADNRVEGDSPTAVIGFIIFALALVAAFLPAIGLRLAAITAGAGFSLFAAIVVIAAKTNEVFDFGGEAELKTGAYLAILGFVLGIVGVFLALAGLIHKTPQQPATAPPGSAGTGGSSVASLVLSILGIFVPLLAALGIGFGILALDDHRRSGGAIGGKGKATAGIIIGLIVLVGYTIGLGLGIPLSKSGS